MKVRRKTPDVPLVQKRGTAGRSSFLSLLLCLLLFAPSSHAADASIVNYRPVFHAFLESDTTVRIAWRAFEEKREAHLLVVDPVRFEVAKVKRRAVEGKPLADMRRWVRTPFAAALKAYAGPPYPLQNAGIRRAERPAAGYFLTVDLCPSKRPLDRALFRKLAALQDGSGIPASVGVAVTGVWIRRHGEDFRWLVDLAHSPSGGLRIVWINHSFSHPYDPRAPLEKNFLLRPGVDFSFEVLETEKLLLQHNLLPSPFFRFPGLASDRRLLEGLSGMALVPVGSGAWLAKGESPRPGDIILIHGNGNEPRGVSEFYRLLETASNHRVASEIFPPLPSAFAGAEVP